nr:Tetraspanin and Cytochrome c oxidase biogenesis protein Cmc1 domain containing protein [Haemonchus contortus]
MLSSLHCSYDLTQKALLSLNFFYVAIGGLLIFTSAYAKSASIVTSVSVLGGIIAAGVFLIAVALLGIYGTKKQHQAALFFYMIILSCVFTIQFIVAIVCLGNVSESSLEEVVMSGWKKSDEAVKWDAQKAFNCCGLRKEDQKSYVCSKLQCHNYCEPCLPIIVDVTSNNLSRVGLLGLFFSFTELVGVWLAYRFRNTRDPSVDPDTLFLSIGRDCSVMLPDLSPHLHTRECNFLIDLLLRCQKEKTIGKLFGQCSYWDEAVWQCTKKERIWRREHNPHYTKRYMELRNLPEDYWTPALRKLKEQGLMPDLTQSDGCRI